jgi:hypothetical protein
MEAGVTKRSVPGSLAVLLLLGLSPLDATTLNRGIDLFTTTADGTTYSDFSHNPIPAGFFCPGSAPFSGRVGLKGLPLTTAAPGQLQGADTIIERLDDATFDTKGKAATRIQFRALSLVSIDPIKTSCGAFHVYVSLAKGQRITQMSLLRSGDEGGKFVAPLAVNARVRFIPVEPARTRVQRPLEINRSFTFPAKPIPFSVQSGVSSKGSSAVNVDTDGDLSPDLVLPGTSNFLPGQPTQSLIDNGCPSCRRMECHDWEGEQHCYYPTYPWDCQIVDDCPF